MRKYISTPEHPFTDIDYILSNEKEQRCPDVAIYLGTLEDMAYAELFAA